jgi:pyruvate dehydrogenase E1 component beta subunit
MNIVEAIKTGLREEMERDKDVIILGEDVGIDGGVFRVTDGLFKKFGDKRVIDTPLAELGIVSISIGLAVYGMKPVPEIQFSGFLYSTIDQIINHASRIRNRSRGKYTCPITIRSPYSGGIHAPEHHSESMEALFAHIPGLKVVIPSNPYDAKGLLSSSIRDPDPVVFLEPKKIYRAVKGDVPSEEYSVPLGKAKVRKEGSDVSVFCWGAMVPVCEAAAQKTKHSVEIVDLRTVSPLDIETILGSVKKTGRAVIVHEAPRTCGVGAEIAALISDRDLLYLEAPVARVTGYDVPVPLSKLEGFYLPDSKRVLRGIEKVMSF